MCEDKKQTITYKVTTSILIGSVGFLLALYMTSCMGKLSKIQLDINTLQVQIAQMQCKMMTREDAQVIACDEIKKFIYERDKRKRLLQEGLNDE